MWKDCTLKKFIFLADQISESLILREKMAPAVPPPNKPTPSTSDIEPWIAARAYLDVLGKIPVTFTTPVRSLMIDQREGGVMSPASQLLSTRLLRSPSVKAMFYYATLSFHGEKVSNSAYLSSLDLLRTFQPAEIAALLSTSFMYRRIVKIHNLAENQAWLEIALDATTRMEVGFHLGAAIPAIGPMVGLIVGGFDTIASGLMQVKDPDNYKEYRSYLDMKGCRYDIDYEMEHWGCSRFHIAGNALQLLGYGVPVAHAYLMGLTLGEQPVESELFQWRIAETWIDALISTGAEPDILHQGKYFPAEKNAHKMLYEVGQINENGSKHKWLMRKKDDINPQDTPQLYQECLMEMQQPQEIEQFYEEHLPDELRKSLSKQQLEELSKFDDGESDL